MPTLILLTDFFPRLLLKGSFCRDFVQFREFCACYRFKANLEVGHKCVNAIRITSPKIPSPINICVSFPNYKTVIKFGKQNNLCFIIVSRVRPFFKKNTRTKSFHYETIIITSSWKRKVGGILIMEIFPKSMLILLRVEILGSKE